MSKLRKYIDIGDVEDFINNLITNLFLMLINIGIIAKKY